VTVEPLALRGAALWHGTRHRDERGHLQKHWVAATAVAHGLRTHVEEVVSTFNRTAGTVRGMHYQLAPHEETKTLWVTAGRLLDVLVDLRADEPTYGRWVSVELTGDDDLTLQVPPGVAHGYQTLEDGTSLTYLIDAPYAPGSARTLAYDDPTLAIAWPLPVGEVSGKDREGHAWPPPAP
jgi:dTDP-4-dehydrorhamnose 3,5-epimerase